jgi:hypothetical protein
MVYIDARMHKNNEMPKRGTIVNVTGTISNHVETKKNVKAKHNPIIGQASNNHSSFFNKLSYGKNKFGFVSTKEMNLRNTMPTKPVNREINSNRFVNTQSTVQYKNISNAKTIHKPIASSNVQNNKIINTRNVPIKSGSLKPVFHSRPQSIGRHHQLNNSIGKQAQQKKFILDLGKVNKQPIQSQTERYNYNVIGHKKHEYRGGGSVKPKAQYKGFRSSRVVQTQRFNNNNQKQTYNKSPYNYNRNEIKSYNLKK